MTRFPTKYQKVANQIIDSHPMRTLRWHGNRLFWKARKGWLELVVGSSGSWFQASEETTAILDKENQA